MPAWDSPEAWLVTGPHTGAVYRSKLAASTPLASLLLAHLSKSTQTSACEAAPVAYNALLRQ